MTIYNITPVAKPRMTQSDRWQKRPATAKYWTFKDEVRKLGVQVPVSGAHIIFNMPIAKSRTKKEKTGMLGQPHQLKPDIDNLLKALLDAIYDEDQCVWDLRVTKRWAETGSIEIT